MPHSSKLHAGHGPSQKKRKERKKRELIHLQCSSTAWRKRAEASNLSTAQHRRAQYGTPRGADRAKRSPALKTEGEREGRERHGLAGTVCATEKMLKYQQVCCSGVLGRADKRDVLLVTGVVGVGGWRGLRRNLHGFLTPLIRTNRPASRNPTLLQDG